MILLIDTAQETGTIALSEGGKILFSEENKIAKEHATWLHAAMGSILDKAKKTVRDLDAVSVIAGPGSYTGLRVGMAAAKGLCYALKIPLITLNTLRVMAESMKSYAEEKGAWICPLIDARRDEVFTALYNSNMQEILPPQALILDKTSFETELSQNAVLFFGSGREKWEKISNSKSAIFESQYDIIQAFVMLTQQSFDSGKWSDPVYSEPVYLKEFFSY
jgi:tRNA threonylcarbamoyladenosine biosynthesis protein TsaB